MFFVGLKRFCLNANIAVSELGLLMLFDVWIESSDRN